MFSCGEVGKKMEGEKGSEGGGVSVKYFREEQFARDYILIRSKQTNKQSKIKPYLLKITGVF